jgi:hypothetical protein
VLSGATGQEAQGVLRVLPQIVPEEVTLGAGWSVECPHRFVSSRELQESIVRVMLAKVSASPSIACRADRERHPGVLYG